MDNGKEILSPERIDGQVKKTRLPVAGPSTLTLVLVEPGGMTTASQQEHGPAVRIMQMSYSSSQTIKEVPGTSLAVAHHK